MNVTWMLFVAMDEATIGRSPRSISSQVSPSSTCSTKSPGGSTTRPSRGSASVPKSVMRNGIMNMRNAIRV
jgi:hypothetical protein